MEEKRRHSKKGLPADYVEMLYRRHFQGALVRSGASVAMWVFALTSYLTNTIKLNHFTGITLSVLYLILVNPPTLLLLKRITDVRLYKYGSLLINFLEILGYTAIIYFLGGIEATFLTPIYAALITYVGVVSPRSFPYIIAFLCSTAFGFVVVSESFGLLPRQSVDPFFNPPWMLRLINLSVVIGLLFVVAYISSLTAGILKKNRNRLREQNVELTDAMDRVRRESIERERTTEALRESEGRFRGLFEQAAVGVAEIVMETGQFITVNRRLCEMVGRTEEELMATTFLAITHPEDLHLHEEKTALLLAGEIDHYSLEKRYLRKDGGIVWVNIEVSPLWKPGEKPGRNMIVVEDITERKRMEAEIREMSLRDLLTDLYNRRGFITLAEQQIRAADRARRTMLLMFIDCDGLKWINDTLGHEEGDKALIDTANVLRQTFRKSDIIARLGGDEFAVLSIDAADINPEDFPKRLQQNIDEGNAKEARPYKLAMSWGTAVYDPGSPLSLDELMSSADKLMYAQKMGKSNRRN